MSQELKIAILGYGTVGKQVFDYLKEQQDKLEINQTKYKLVALSSKNRKPHTEWVESLNDLIENKEVDVFIELAGGDNDFVYNLVKSALNNKVSVITANKALIAKYGNELMDLAKDKNVALCYEAAVAGAIPVISTIGNLCFENITEISAIINGTCNYILTQMENSNLEFDKALKLAQEKGYAEADPKLDIDGTDTVQKIAILSSLAYGEKINADNVNKISIENLNKESFQIAKNLTSKIRLLATSYIKNGEIFKYVIPSLVSNDNNFSSVIEAKNAVLLKTNMAKEIFLSGYGAGGEETASAVISDLSKILSRQYEKDIKERSLKDSNFEISQREFLIHGDLEGLKNIQAKLEELNLSVTEKNIENCKVFYIKNLQDIEIKEFFDICKNYNLLQIIT
jgi:homoserine dehydrogenase